MESDAELQSALQEAERGAAAPWIDYPPTPWWYFPAAGAWAATFVATHALPERSLAYLVLVLVLVLFVRWDRHRRGTWPDLRHPPQELHRAMWSYLAGCAVLITSVVLLAVHVHLAVAALAAFAMVTAGLAWYERAYRHAAAAARRRLS